MKLFQINLPTHSNKGGPLISEHLRFQESVLDIAGGYTIAFPMARGLWRAPDGVTYDESVTIYHIACKGSDVDTPNDEWDAIVARAKRLFSEQICLFVAELGEAQLV